MIALYKNSYPKLNHEGHNLTVVEMEGRYLVYCQDCNEFTGEEVARGDK